MNHLRTSAAALLVLAGLGVTYSPGASAAACAPTTWCESVNIYGHRAREYPAAPTNENTLVALAYDARKGVRCETDTPRIADEAGRPSRGPSVIFHDVTPAPIDRVVSAASMAAAGVRAGTTIDEVTPTQFARLRTEGGEPLPTLREWIAKAGQLGVRCMVELKYRPADPQQVKDWADAAGANITFYQQPQRAPQFQCALNGIAAMHAVGFAVGIKQSPDAECQMTFGQMKAVGATYLAAYRDTLTRDYVASAPDGFKVGAMLVGEDGWSDMAAARVDFVIVNVPHLFKDWATR